MIYMGTEDAKILSCNIKDIFSSQITRGISSIEAEKYGEDELRQLL